MKKVYIKIDGMHCSHCELIIRNILLEISNIRDVKFDNNVACITYNSEIDRNHLINIIIENGYITKNEYISENIKDLKSYVKLKEFLVIFVCIISLIFLFYKIFGYNIFNVIPAIDSSITYGMLFVTGLLTSIHCISMCGAINLVAVSNNSKRNIKGPFLYNFGRILSYTLLGGLVGAIGSVFSINQKLLGIIILIAAVIMFMMALRMLGFLNFKCFRIFRTGMVSRNPFVIGLLNGFMPCGPLQAMQVYALSTGSFMRGALSMLLFGLGTVPIMLFTGVILNIKKCKVLINKVASVLILILSIMMLNRGLLALDIDVLRIFNNYDKFVPSVIKDGYQEVEFDLDYNSYEDVILQKGLPVRMIIHVDKSKLTGCNNEIIINEFGIKQALEVGDNVIEFIPDDTGTFTYTCWMNMIKNTIKVIDNESYFKGE